MSGSGCEGICDACFSAHALAGSRYCSEACAKEDAERERDQVTVLRTRASDWITAKELRDMGFDLPSDLPDVARTLRENLVRDPDGGKISFRDGKISITGLVKIRGESDFIVPLAPGEEPRPGNRVCLEWDATSAKKDVRP